MERAVRASAQRQQSSRAGRVASTLGLVSVCGALTFGLATGSASMRGSGPGLAGFGTATAGAPRDEPGSFSGARTAPHGAFTISGSVTGLYPGVSRALPLTVTNHEPFTIVVILLTTIVKNAGPACGSANLRVSDFAGGLVIGPGASSPASVTARMIAAAPDGCVGAAFPLTYVGVAIRAPR
ncbi:MAG: hypothetical protein ACHQFZ_06285 [Acidimicrobiales bacterium]